MDIGQVVFNIIIGVAGFLGITLMSLILSRLSTVEKDVKDIPNIYARRDDVKEGFLGLKDMLVRIEEKLDRKADK